MCNRADSGIDDEESTHAQVAGRSGDIEVPLGAPPKARIPDVVFRGSDKAFDPITTRARDGAHWFTSDEAHASSFGSVSRYRLSLSRPMEISQGDLDAAWDDAHPEGLQDERCLLPRDFVAGFVAKAACQGYDGLIIRKMGDRDVQADMFLPLDPKSIKPLAR